MTLLPASINLDSRKVGGRWLYLTIVTDTSRRGMDGQRSTVSFHCRRVLRARCPTNNGGHTPALTPVALESWVPCHQVCWREGRSPDWSHASLCILTSSPAQWAKTTSLKCWTGPFPRNSIYRGLGVWNR